MFPGLGAVVEIVFLLDWAMARYGDCVNSSEPFDTPNRACCRYRAIWEDLHVAVRTWLQCTQTLPRAEESHGFSAVVCHSFPKPA